MATVGKSTSSSGTNIGLNVQGIDNVFNAIDSYKQTLTQKIDGLFIPRALQGKAIQGEASLKDLATSLEQIKTELKNHLNFLQSYIDTINDVKKVYQSQDSSNQTFSSAAKNFQNK